MSTTTNVASGVARFTQTVNLTKEELVEQVRLGRSELTVSRRSAPTASISPRSTGRISQRRARKRHRHWRSSSPTARSFASVPVLGPAPERMRD